MISNPMYLLLLCLLGVGGTIVLALYLGAKDVSNIQKAVKPMADDDLRMATEEFYRDQQLAAWEEDNWPDAQDERRYRDDE